MSAALQPTPPGRMTVEEFLEWPPHPHGLRQQLVDGLVTSMAPASATHGLISSNVNFALTGHLRQARPGCHVISEPGISPRVQRGTNLRVPDLAVTCDGVHLGDRTLEGPVLVVEILSPSNETETRSNIWTYCSIPSVVEILVVHSIRFAVELLRRQPDGAWPPQFERFDDPAATLTLTSVGGVFGLAAFYVGTDFAVLAV